MIDLDSTNMIYGQEGTRKGRPWISKASTHENWHLA
jgi:hypothetical protein